MYDWLFKFWLFVACFSNMSEGVSSVKLARWQWMVLSSITTTIRINTIILYTRLSVWYCCPVYNNSLWSLPRRVVELLYRVLWPVIVVLKVWYSVSKFCDACTAMCSCVLVVQWRNVLQNVEQLYIAWCTQTDCMNIVDLNCIVSCDRV